MVVHFSNVGYVLNLTKYYHYFNTTSMFSGRDGVYILYFLDFWFGGILVYSGVLGAWHASCSSCIKELMGRIREAEMQYRGRIWWV
jgi:hypothetical protein